MPVFRVLALCLVLCISSVAPALAQSIQFGRSFDKTGKLIEPGDEYPYQDPQVFVAVKMVARGTLPVDTLFLIVKDINGVAGRYYMKRSKSKLEANAIIRLRADGIYRVYIYNPLKRIRPVGFATVFATSKQYPKKADLIERQRLILVERGVIKDRKQETTTASVSPAAEALADATDADGNAETELEDDLESLDDDLSDDDLALLGDANDDLDALDADDDLEKDTEEMPDEDLSGEFESFDDLEGDFGFDIEDF